MLGEQRHIQPLRPVCSLLGAKTPGIALGLHPLERPRELRGKAGLLLDEVAAHVHNLVHVLDEHWAGLLTGPASGAGPQHVVVDEPLTHNVLPHLSVSRL